MFVANITLARHIEAAECRLVVELSRGARARGEKGFVVPVGGGAAVFAGIGSPMSKMIGVGLEQLDEAALHAAEQAHDRSLAPLRAEVCTLAPPETFPTLVERGYALSGFEHVLGRTPSDEDGSARSSDVDIAVSTYGDRTDWVSAMAEGFATPDGSAPGEDVFPLDTLQAMFRELAEAEYLRRYIARLEGTVVGAASLFQHDRVAILAGAATRAAYRRKGVQRALLQRRLADLATAQCEAAVITTQPGSQSQANAERAGFRMLYARAIMIRPPRRAS